MNEKIIYSEELGGFYFRERNHTTTIKESICKIGKYKVITYSEDFKQIISLRIWLDLKLIKFRYLSNRIIFWLLKRRCNKL